MKDVEGTSRSRADRARNGGGLRRRIGLIAGLALVAGFALPAAAQGATPIIVNNADVASGQKQWLESFTMGLEDNDQDRDVRITLLVQHDIGRTVTGLKIDDNNNGVDDTLTVGTTALTGTQTQQPTVSGGYGYTRVTYQWKASIANSGITGSVRRISNRKLNIRAVLDNGDTTATSTSDIRGTAATNSSGTQDYPYIYWRGVPPTHPATDQSTTPGGTLEFRYTCDDPDGDFFSSDDDCRGVNWRLRNVLTGATVDPASSWSCPNGDNTRKDIFITFPSRGRWVVEGELQNEGGSCGSSNANPGYWWLIGSADVNSTAAPSVSLGLNTNRPNTNGTVTATATIGADPDSANGGATEYVEWDLDNNGTFETVTRGDTITGLTSPQAKTIDTTGMSPGLKTVRVRVTDNGALGGADDIRRTSTEATATFTVNTPPNANAKTLNVAKDDTNAPITLSGTDPVNGDAISSYNIQTPPADGTLGGSGANRTYTPDAGFTGTDTFTYTVTDDHNGTSTAATVTVNVVDSGVGGKVGPDTIIYNAASGDLNSINVTGGGGSDFVITDAGGNNVVPNAGCSVSTPTSVTCGDAGINYVIVNLSDSNDTSSAATVGGSAQFTINGGNGADQITGSPGNDALNGGTGDAATDRLEGGAGNDTLNGGPGIDRALYGSSGGDLTITMDNAANDSDGVGGTDNVNDTIESITGGTGNDTLTGSCYANTLAGQGGNDTLNGDPNSCGVYGGDFMGGGTGNDGMVGRGGSDTVTYTTNTGAQPINVSLDGVANDSDGVGGTDNLADDIEYVYGGAGADTIDATGALAGVSLWGRAGNDILTGSPFDDYLHGEAGADTLDCAGGAGDMYDVDGVDLSVTNCEIPG